MVYGVVPRMNDLTIAVGVTRGFLPQLAISLSTVPARVPVVVSWLGDREPDIARENTTVVRPRRVLSNYSRGYMLNVAIRVVKTPFVLLADADFLYPSFFFDTVRPRAAEILRFYVGRLTRAATQVVLGGTSWESLYADYQGTRNRIFSRIYGAHNPCIYPTQLLHYLRGYDERISGWGGEDDDLTNRTRAAGFTDRRLPIVVGDLDHADSPDFAEYARGRTSAATRAILRDGTRPCVANPSGWGDAG